MEEKDREVKNVVKGIKEKIYKIKKENILIIFLIGILLLVITLPTKSISNSSRKGLTEQNKEAKESANDNYQVMIEKELEEILGYINGVGKVKVMVTVKDGGTDVIEKDRVTMEEKQNDNTEQRKEETSIYEEVDNGEKPFVVATKKPQVEGVLVVCEGGDEPKIKGKVLEAIMALFPVESHKISIIGAGTFERSMH